LKFSWNFQTTFCETPPKGWNLKKCGSACTISFY
jgi:hypothetical protein